MNYRETLLRVAREAHITKADLLSPRPDEPMYVTQLRSVTWAFEQLDPEYKRRARRMDLRQIFGSDLYPSGITIISNRTERALIGFRFNADDFYEGTFIWNGVTFDPFYHAGETDEEDPDEEDEYPDELLVIDWQRNNPQDASILKWKLEASNIQNHEDTTTDAIYTKLPTGQILLPLPPSLEGAPNSFCLEIQNLDLLNSHS